MNHMPYANCILHTWVGAPCSEIPPKICRFVVRVGSSSCSEIPGDDRHRESGCEAAI